MKRMFDTNAVSALAHHRRGFDRLAAIADSLAIADRLVSAITLSELETMIAKTADPGGKAGKVPRSRKRSPSSSMPDATRRRSPTTRRRS